MKFKLNACPTRGTSAYSEVSDRVSACQYCVFHLLKKHYSALGDVNPGSH